MKTAAGMEEYERRCSASNDGLKLGVNGFGRIGKLTVWHHVARKYFNEIVVNIGRQAGTSLEDIAHYVERDSTYGRLHTYLYGQNAQPVVERCRRRKRQHDRWTAYG